MRDDVADFGVVIFVVVVDAFVLCGTNDGARDRMREVFLKACGELKNRFAVIVGVHRHDVRQNGRSLR